MWEGGAAKAKSRVVCVGSVFVLSSTALLVNLYRATSLPGGAFHFQAVFAGGQLAGWYTTLPK